MCIRDRPHIEPKNTVLRNALGEQRIERVNALDDREAARLQGQALGLGFAPLRDEIELRQLAAALGQQPAERLVETVDVDRADML